MLRRAVPFTLVMASLLVVGVAPSQAQNYRGMSPGWPNHSNGYYAAYQPYGFTQPQIVARPMIPVVPVTAAYANPAYYGAYSAGYRGTVAPVNYGGQQTYAQQPTATYYAPPAAQYAPQYAPQQSYAVSPAGSSYAGGEAATYYGQPTRVNYVPPQVSYRPAYAQVPVYAYRPVTTYYAGSMQQTTCQQPVAPVTSCQPTTSRCGGLLSWLNPFNHRWLKHNWFGGGGCGSPPPTTAYCGQPVAPTTAYCGQTYAAPTVAACGATTSGCGQPYYPAPANVIPLVPSTPGTIITPAQPSIRSPIIGTPTVPSPPTRFPSTGVPADSPPSLGPGTIITPAPGSGSFPTGSGSTTPGSTPGGSFGTGGSFGSGTNYAPATDPYTGSSGSFSTSGASATRSTRREMTEPTASSDGVIRAPASAPKLPPGVQTIPDPDAKTPRANDRAPQLLDPRDKMATRRVDSRWAVVPAVWPEKSSATSPYTQPLAQSDATPRGYQPVSRFEPAAADAAYDDSGWRSGR